MVLTIIQCLLNCKHRASALTVNSAACYCLRIENFALIELDLEFSAGLNVLTGETGAGKSIIWMRCCCCWGKVDRRVIRTGANQAMVEATFKLNLSRLVSRTGKLSYLMIPQWSVAGN